MNIVTRVAVVSDLVLFPNDNGAKAKILGLSRELQDIGHEVHFVHLTSERQPPANWPQHVAEFGSENAHLIYSGGRATWLSYKVKRFAAKIVRRALELTRSEWQNYYLLDETVRPGYGPKLAALAKKKGFDCVIVEYVYLAKLLDFLEINILKIIDTHDVFADRHKKIVSAGDLYRWYSISPAVERNALRKADVILAIEDDEARHFRKELGSHPRVQMVSHFVEPSEPIQQIEAPHAAFLGSATMGNIDSLRFLLQDVMPLILEREPEFKLFVAGGICERLDGERNVVSLGKVADVRELFVKAPVLLSPTRIGTGIAIKLLSALAHGVPIVATETGARGHKGSDGVIVVPDLDPSAFAEATLHLLSDFKLRKKLAHEASLMAVAWNRAQREELAKAINSEQRLAHVNQSYGAKLSAQGLDF